MYERELTESNSRDSRKSTADLTWDRPKRLGLAIVKSRCEDCELALRERTLRDWRRMADPFYLIHREALT
jgi:hypothetical protein